MRGSRGRGSSRVDIGEGREGERRIGRKVEGEGGGSGSWFMDI